MNDHVSVDRDGHVHDLLSELLEGDLPDAERQRVEEHLAQCAECRRDWQSLRLTVQLVRQIPSRAVPRSFTVPVQPTRLNRSIFWLRLSTGALAAIFVALLAVQLVLPTAPPGRSVAAFPPGRAERLATSLPVPTEPASAAMATAGPAVRPAAAPIAPGPQAGQGAASHALPPTPVASAAGVKAFAAAPSSAASPTASAAEAPMGAVSSAAGPSDQAEPSTTGVASLAPPAPSATRAPTEAETSTLAAARLPAWYPVALISVGALALASLVALLGASRRTRNGARW